jgi:four helix bundle protein
MGKQCLRSGTAIGALIREAEYAQSKPDFINKLSIAIKETNEVLYWLELLFHTEYIDQKLFDSLKENAEEILKLLTSIINTSKKNIVSKSR